MTSKRLAMVFPGQGSQTVGMGAAMALEYESAAAIHRRADEVLGWSITDLCFSGPAEKLNRTEYAQPALYVTSVAAAAVLEEKGVQAQAVCGHSLGEYSALAAAGALEFEEGLKLVAFRGEAMGRLAGENPGSMAAVLGLEDSRVEEICERAGEVWPVNYNSPGQLVISGETGSVQRAMAAAEEAGAKKVVELPVSGAFHSRLMQTAAEQMRNRLEETRFTDPAPPFLSSTTSEYEAADSLSDVLVRQIVSPVRWRQAVEKLVAEGVDTFFEVGNGKVLCGLIRRIDRAVTAVPVSDPDSLEKALAAVAAP